MRCCEPRRSLALENIAKHKAVADKARLRDIQILTWDYIQRADRAQQAARVASAGRGLQEPIRQSFWARVNEWIGSPPSIR